MARVHWPSFGPTMPSPLGVGTWVTTPLAVMVAGPAARTLDATTKAKPVPWKSV